MVFKLGLKDYDESGIIKNIWKYLLYWIIVIKTFDRIFD